MAWRRHLEGSFLQAECVSFAPPPRGPSTILKKAGMIGPAVPGVAANPMVGCQTAPQSKFRA